jgi:hypothetical protein
MKNKHSHKHIMNVPKRSGSSLLTVPVIALVTLGVGVAALSFSTRVVSGAASVSPEVRFADASRKGLAIVPASGQSCAGYLPTTADAGGYVLSAGATQEQITKNGYNFCVTNSGGSWYFVPAATANELSSFVNAIPNLNGVSQQAAP